MMGIFLRLVAVLLLVLVLFLMSDYVMAEVLPGQALSSCGAGLAL